MLDVFEIRKLRIRELLKEHGGKHVTLAEFLNANGMNISPSYISRMLSDSGSSTRRKRVTEEYAAEIERAAHKPEGWLSNLDSPDSPWPFGFSRERWDRLESHQRRRLSEALELMIAGAEKDSLPQNRQKRRVAQ